MAEKSSPALERTELIQRFVWEMRKMSTATMLHVSSVAQQVGLSANDLKCAELLLRDGPMTAGLLAERSGLTTGAVTGVADRLEQAGWARRQADPADRRRVIIEALPRESRALAGLYDSYMRSVSELLSHYDDQQLALILEFFSRFSAISFQEAARMRASADR